MGWWMIAVCWCATVGIAEAFINKKNVNGEQWEVKIEQGPVRGHRDPDGEVYSFYNIPYATAPKGENKFKPALPPPIWTEPYDAIDKRIICPQFFDKVVMPDNVKVQENCLVINVFVPNTEKINLPVLVYVHGGGFEMLYGNWRQAKNMVKYGDFIVVSFNYRLGIYGFLCLGTESAPGNAGMKDQVMALKWVQQNIAKFGGNPNDVTVEGYSAGSASVDLLMIAKSAEGLFHKVIPESGANIASFAIQIDPIQNAKDHAKKLNFTNVDDIHALETFYKTLPQNIVTLYSFMDSTDSSFAFAPCVERDTGDKAFLTETPLSILKRGDFRKLPMLYGFANMEGLWRMNYFDFWKDKMNEKFSDFLPRDLKFDTEEEKEEVAKQIKQFYFEDNPVDDKSVLGFIDYFSDVLFDYPVLRAVKLHVESGHDQIYLYEYSFADESDLVPHTNVRGAGHCAQSLAVLDGNNVTHSDETVISKKYKEMKKRLRDIWHRFITTDKPMEEGSSLPSWPAVGVNRSPHMSLGEKFELRGPLLEKRTRFWDNIYEKYYREPIPPRPFL